MKIFFLKPSGSSQQSKRMKRGPTKKLEGRYIITEVAPDGEPIAPEAAAQKYVRQCGCLVRDHIPITYYFCTTLRGSFLPCNSFSSV